MKYKNLIGKQAPIFTLKDQNNKNINLGTIIGEKNIVIYFYPKADTPGCTTESCQFRDNYEEFLAADCMVFGISSDKVSAQRNFAGKYKLPFSLLSDYGGKVRELYQVPKSMWILPRRVTYIIDKKGIIRHIFNSQLKVTQHVEEAISVIKSF